MRVYHLDCWSGIAGDMFLGACVDLGMPLGVVEEAVARLGLPGVAVEAKKGSRGGLAGTRFRVLVGGRPVEGPDPDEETAGGRAHEHDDHGEEHHHHREHAHHHPHGHEHDRPHHHPAGDPHASPADLSTHPHPHPREHGHAHGRSLADILALLRAGSLPAPVRERAERIFVRLGEAEAAAHGVPVETVHFHEVGAVDSIVDLVGAAAAVEHLAPARLTASAVNLGGGRVRTAHGELPVPAPATARLLAGVPVYGGTGGELTTPTGAVLLAELVDAFGEAPGMVLEGSGYGLGRKETAGRPNALRLLAGRAVEAASARPEVEVLECEIDDLPGEGFGFLMERLLAAGALDVFFTPVQMKKNRPGTLVTVLCRPPELEPITGLLLAESGSLGCRFHRAARIEAEREVVEVETAYGKVAVKRAWLDGRPLASAPEYESVRRLALAHDVPWREVHRAALAALAR